MSDEEEEAFSASASSDEWKPSTSRRGRGGESDSDDDDSDFEVITGTAGGSSRKRESEEKNRNTAKTKASAAKKRKPTGQSLRTKLYNKYRPPPKTFSSPTNSGGAGSNSPSASTSRTASKNVKKPNENNDTYNGGTEAANEETSSSESSVDDYLVDPAELDLRSSFFNPQKGDEERLLAPQAPPSPPPVFDCNAGLGNLSDSGSEDNKDSSADERAFNFHELLEKANSLERAKGAIAKRAAEAKSTADQTLDMSISSLLTLGEKQKSHSHDNDIGVDEDRDGDNVVSARAPQRLNKTKSTRVKRHTKTRPTSTVAAGDTDDSDFEEVADEHTTAARMHGTNNTTQQQQQNDSEMNDCLEIHVELPFQNRTKATKSQNELELAFKRKLNRNLKERQLLLHKTTLLCRLARNYTYNRLLNDTKLMQAALQILPSKNAYPPKRGTEIKYFQSFVTWYKSAIQLTRTELYPPKKGVTKRHIRQELIQQVRTKEAHSKQDFVMIFVVLLRAMGLQCRLVVNMQPLPLRPPQSDLVPIKLNAELPKSPPKATNTNVNVQTEKKTNRSRLKSTKSQESPTVVETKKTEPKAATAAVQPDLVPIKLNAELPKLLPKTTNTNVNVQSEKKVNLSRLKSTKSQEPTTVVETKKTVPKTVAGAVRRGESIIEVGSPKVPKIVIASNTCAPATSTKTTALNTKATKSTSKTVSKSTPLTTEQQHSTRSRSRSKSPGVHVSAAFLQTTSYRVKFGVSDEAQTLASKRAKSKSPTTTKVKVCPDFLKAPAKRILRPRQTTNELVDVPTTSGLSKEAKTGSRAKKHTAPQMDGNDDGDTLERPKRNSNKRPQLRKLQKKSKNSNTDTEEVNSDEDFMPSPKKRPKKAPVLPKTIEKSRRVLSTDEEDNDSEISKKRANELAADIWAEVWSDLEDRWVCVDLFKGKVDMVDSIRRGASTSLAYVFAFQNDLSLKDVTARYCPHWTTTVRKARVDKAWLDDAIAPYLGQRTQRDCHEDIELRRIHEQKPLPTTISDFKDHPLYALQRHLLKFQAIYPPDAPTLGFIRGEPIYARDCVHLLHSREIWLKQARTVKLGQQPYKVVKARPKWDRHTQTVIKDQPLEIFGYWQTEEYDPPTAENGVVPRNAYGNVELFKECMLPKKTVHIKLPGLNRICKKLNIDCANAVIGFDFHQGACHPMFDGFVVCQEFADKVIAAWHQNQEEQEQKELEKREQRIWGNWKRLIRGLLIRERLKKKYNI